MANPFNALNPSNPMRAYDTNGLQSAYKALTGSKNPMQAFQRMAAQNPRLAPVMQALRGGADPQSLFVSLCRQRGIDPNEFIRGITGNGSNGAL